MSISSVGASTSAYSYLQSLLPPQQADGSGRAGSGDPVSQLLQAFYPNGANSTATSPPTDSASTTTASSSPVVRCALQFPYPGRPQERQEGGTIFMARTDAVVLGAGIVGTSVALHLAKRGLSVALVDRRGPGEETSYGNAGVIEGNTVFPPAFPNRLSGRCCASRSSGRRGQLSPRVPAARGALAARLPRGFASGKARSRPRASCVRCSRARSPSTRR